MYLASKQPLITSQMIDQVKGLFGLIMTLLSIVLLIYKWFKAPEENAKELAGLSEGGDDGRPGIADHVSSISSNLSKLE